MLMVVTGWVAENVVHSVEEVVDLGWVVGSYPTAEETGCSRHEHLVGHGNGVGLAGERATAAALLWWRRRSVDNDDDDDKNNNNRANRLHLKEAQAK